eukprot:747395-Hanusia_phi.AAC.4
MIWEQTIQDNLVESWAAEDWPGMASMGVSSSLLRMVLLVTTVRASMTFVLSPSSLLRVQRSGGRRTLSIAGRLNMCICVNCKWVERCKAYHFVEEQHKQPHLTLTPDFVPRDGSPTIEAIVRTGDVSPKHLLDRGITIEYDVVKCDDFVRDDGRWSKMMPAGTLLDAGMEAFKSV